MMFAIVLTGVLFSCNQSNSSQSILNQHPYNSVAVGQSKSDVRKILGNADRELEASEISNISHEDANEVWYYSIPLRPNDFDTYSFLVFFDDQGVVMGVDEFSN